MSKRLPPKSDDLFRTVSRHSLTYVLCSISESFRHYDFDPIDLLIIYGTLNANVIKIMKDKKLDKQFGSINAVEPDHLKQGVSRAALSRFFNLPLETVRRRVERLRQKRILTEDRDGLIVTDGNSFKFGNNHELQMTNALLVKKLLRDLQAAGIFGPDDF